MWLDDMEIGYKVTEDESACLGDEDEEMKDISRLCVRLGVEDMELEDGSFTWGEEVLAHMEIDTILAEKHDELYAEDERKDSKDIQTDVTELGVGIGERVGIKLAIETAYYKEGTW